MKLGNCWEILLKFPNWVWLPTFIVSNLEHKLNPFIAKWLIGWCFLKVGEKFYWFRSMNFVWLFCNKIWKTIYGWGFEYATWNPKSLLIIFLMHSNLDHILQLRSLEKKSVRLLWACREVCISTLKYGFGLLWKFSYLA